MGELDCSKLTFAGKLVNGTFSVPLGLPVPFTQRTFAVHWAGDYDPMGSRLSGPWDMTGEPDGFPGSCVDGSWSAVWIP